MRYLCVAMLVLALALPAVAASPQYALVYNLTFNSDGTISGTFGGIPVSGTWGGGSWTLTIDGKTFATGTYTCNGTCTFTGTTLMGKSASFTFSSATLTGTKTGQLAGVFSNHGGWVSSVTKWASANLTGVRRGQIVSAAAHNNQLWKQANGNGSAASANSHSKEQSNNGGGNGKGKGPK
ncbi:MAG TPA: hypothetical protein VGR24_00530 [bacterium]|jgi:hypothetical protein|nr:hypothetical protein [bacterium]